MASRLNRISIGVTSSTAVSSDEETISSVSNSKSLLDSIANLKNTSLYDKTKDEDGNETFNREGIRLELDKFIEYYNATLKAATSSGVSGVVSNLTALKQKTAEYAASLSEVGISIGSDGRLSLKTDTFAKAGADILQKNLTSYASSIETNARLVNYYSTTQNGVASSYSSTGAYSSNASDIVSSLYGQM